MEDPCQAADCSGVSHRETLSNPSLAHRCAFAQQDGDQNLLGSTLAESGLSLPLSTKDLYYLSGNMLLLGNVIPRNRASQALPAPGHEITPLSPHLLSFQRGPQAPHAKSKFLAVTNPPRLTAMTGRTIKTQDTLCFKANAMDFSRFSDRLPNYGVLTTAKQ